MRKLAAGGAGLCEQLRDCRLQQFLGEQEARFERHAAHRRHGYCGLDYVVLQRLVEKPVDVLLENTCHNLDQPLRWHPLAVLDHGKIGHGWTRLGVDLHATNREIF
jgi:hypothetical protein